jgi:hypothetical protein
MALLDEDAAAVLRQADTIVIHAKWMICELAAAERLAAMPGLARTPLFPGHDIIQIVADHGAVIGRIRRQPAADGGWAAIPVGAARPTGVFPDAWAAAHDLAGCDDSARFSDRAQPDRAGTPASRPDGGLSTPEKGRR